MEKQTSKKGKKVIYILSLIHIYCAFPSKHDANRPDIVIILSKQERKFLQFVVGRMKVYNAYIFCFNGKDVCKII